MASWRQPLSYVIVYKQMAKSRVLTILVLSLIMPGSSKEHRIVKVDVLVGLGIVGGSAEVFTANIWESVVIILFKTVMYCSPIHVM